MAVDETLARVRRDLEERYGVDGAAYLLDRPTGGWDALVTKEELDLKLRAQTAELRVELHQELRAQTWRLAKLVLAAQAVVVAVIGGIGALLRFA